MYDYLPVRKSIAARLLVLGLLLLSVASFMTSSLIPSPYHTILQAVGLLLIIPLIQIMTRFVILRYLYRIAPYEDGNVDLEIYAYRGGNKMQLVCRIGLEEITAAVPLTEANRKPPRSLRRYNYCPDMRPTEALVLSITNADGDCEVMLSPDEKMTAILQAPHPAVPDYDPAATEEQTAEE